MRFSVWRVWRVWSGDDECDEKQDGHSADEMGDDDGGLEFFGDGERAKDGLGGDEEGKCEDGCAIFFALSKGDDEGGEDDESQNGGGVSVDDFNPCLFGVQRRFGVSELRGLVVGDSNELSVACGPVGTAESRVRKARKRPQHNHDKNQRQSRNKNASGGHNRILPHSPAFAIDYSHCREAATREKTPILSRSLSRSGVVYIVILNATPYNPPKGGCDEQTTEHGTTRTD